MGNEKSKKKVSSKTEVDVTNFIEAFNAMVRPAIGGRKDEMVDQRDACLKRYLALPNLPTQCTTPLAEDGSADMGYVLDIETLAAACSHSVSAKGRVSREAPEGTKELKARFLAVPGGAAAWNRLLLCLAEAAQQPQFRAEGVLFGKGPAASFEEHEEEEDERTERASADAPSLIDASDADDTSEND